jgi:hypothetical protein
MKFLFGVAIGVVGMWAYSNGKLQALMGQAPEPLTEAFGKATERASQVANNPQVRDFVSKAQDKVSDLATPSESGGSGGISAPEATEAVEPHGAP